MQETMQDGKTERRTITITITIKRTEVVKDDNKKTACKSCNDCKR